LKYETFRIGCVQQRVGIMQRKLFLSIFIVFFTTSLGFIFGCNIQNIVKETSSVSEKSSPDWVEYGFNDDCIFLFKKVNTVKDGGSPIVQVWSKQVFSNNGRENKIKIRKNNSMSIEGYDKLSYEKISYQIDCKKQMSNILSITTNKKDGTVLSSYEYGKEKWEYIHPDSVMDTLQKIVCK